MLRVRAYRVLVTSVCLKSSYYVSRVVLTDIELFEKLTSESMGATEGLRRETPAIPHNGKTVALDKLLPMLILNRVVLLLKEPLLPRLLRSLYIQKKIDEFSYHSIHYVAKYVQP